MKAIIKFKSFPGHLGIPGHQGGSLPMGADKGGGEGGQSTSYASLDTTFKGITEALSNGPVVDGWAYVGNSQDPGVVRNLDNGRITVTTTQRHFVTGKYAMGTLAQQRYAYEIVAVEYRKLPDGKYQRWDSATLYSKALKVAGDADALAKRNKAFIKLTGWKDPFA